MQANILVDSDGRVALTDLGISKQLQDSILVRSVGRGLQLHYSSSSDSRPRCHFMIRAAAPAEPGPVPSRGSSGAF